MAGRGDHRVVRRPRISCRLTHRDLGRWSRRKQKAKAGLRGCQLVDAVPRGGRLVRGLWSRLPQLVAPRRRRADSRVVAAARSGGHNHPVHRGAHRCATCLRSMLRTCRAARGWPRIVSTSCAQLQTRCGHPIAPNDWGQHRSAPCANRPSNPIRRWLSVSRNVRRFAVFLALTSRKC